MNSKKIKKIIIIAVIAAAGIYGAKYAYGLYSQFTEPVVPAKGSLYIPTGSNFDEVLDSLTSNNFLSDTAAFVRVARLKGYDDQNILPGRYIVNKGMSASDLVNKLQRGLQDPVKVTFNNIRTKAEFAGKIAKRIEADSSSLAELMNDNNYLGRFDFDTANIISMFLPDTYEFYWNTAPKPFFKRMKQEYDKFWTESRKQKADSLNMSLQEVAVLASIVQAEQLKHRSERPKIAGLYINRIKKNIPLQSDPTLVFALGDFSKKRVLNKDKEVNSPYNTYKYAGLPPGPINMPEKPSLNAVLDYEKHNYIYMCAKEDFSGYHYFSSNLRQHNIYAKRYQNALNKAKIYK